MVLWGCKDPTKRQSLQAETPGQQRQGVPGFLQLRRKEEASMPRLPLLLLLLGCLGSHGFPATSETQEQDMEMVQVNAEFHVPEMQEPYLLIFPRSRDRSSWKSGIHSGITILSETDSLIQK